MRAGSGTEVHEVVDVAALVCRHATDVVAASIPAGTQRRWVLLHRDDDYEAWAIAWPSGSGLEMHDHDGSRAALVVLDGTLRERYLAPSGELEVRWLDGRVVELPADHTHEVVNIGPHEAISVHVYAPPKRNVRPRDDSPD